MTDLQLILVSVLCTTIVMYVIMEWRIKHLVNDILDDLDARDHALADATGSFINILLQKLQKGLAEELEKLKEEND